MVRRSWCCDLEEEGLGGEEEVLIPVELDLCGGRDIIDKLKSGKLTIEGDSCGRMPIKRRL